ncbi:MAG: DUF4288 domain-containing protein [Bacteroidota bacterium]
MRWYIAKLVFRIVSERDPLKAQFDEQLWLVNASGTHEALHKARKKGMSEEDSVKSQHTGVTRWQFIDVADLSEIGEPTDGMPLYSRVEETEDLKGYLVSVRRRAQDIGEHPLLSGIKTFA